VVSANSHQTAPRLLRPGRLAIASHRSDRWIDALRIKRAQTDDGHLLNDDVSLALSALERAFDEPRKVIVDVACDLNSEGGHYFVLESLTLLNRHKKYPFLSASAPCSFRFSARSRTMAATPVASPVMMDASGEPR